MLTVLRTICFATVMNIALAMLYFSACYAETTSTTITINCSKSSEEAPWHKYKSKPNTKLTLITKGLQLTDENIKLIGFKEYWDEVHHKTEFSNYESAYSIYRVNIIAICKAPNKPSIITRMWPPNKTLACEKGDSLLVNMTTPNDPNPNKYKYIATLIESSDDEKESTINDKMPINETTQQEIPLTDPGLKGLINPNSI